MKLGHVTGPMASQVWKFFTAATGSREPNWNFDGKFLVSKSGEVHLPKEDLEAHIAELVQQS